MTQRELKKLLVYSPETGTFKSVSSGRKIGFKHNCRSAKDYSKGKQDKFYIKLQLGEKRYYAHRLAILYMFGTTPSTGHEIDHVDGDGTNNRISNLRVVTRSENCHFNRNKQRGELPLGVHENKGGFEAALTVRKKRYRKWFPKIEEAVAHRLHLEQLYL